MEWAHEVAHIHKSALPSDIATLLGDSLLTQTFYPSLMGSADVTLGAFIANELTGFVVFSSDQSCYSGLIRNNFLTLAIAGLMKSLSEEFWRNAFSVGRYMLSSGQPPAGSELAYIAVCPRFRGQGIGTRLVERGFERLQTLGILNCWVKTLESTPENIRFYEKLGFTFWSSTRGRMILTTEVIPKIRCFLEGH